jgi:hypothetical protein
MLIASHFHSLCSCGSNVYTCVINRPCYLLKAKVLNEAVKVALRVDKDPCIAVLIATDRSYLNHVIELHQRCGGTHWGVQVVLWFMNKK